MSEDYINRKLIAILCADVKGYSRMMGENEITTLQTLARYLDIIHSYVKKHRGRVVGTEGDSLLGEFCSAVDAVLCAVKIQDSLKNENKPLSGDQGHLKMEFRIGINIGDVIKKKDDIYGDGVNIASRIESLADGGGIAISGTVFDQIKNKLKLGYKFLGERTAKNISEPIRVYRILSDPGKIGKVIGEKRLSRKKLLWAAMGGMAVLIILSSIFVISSVYLGLYLVGMSYREKSSYLLHEESSVAVLPFVNMSSDPDQEFICDGFTEEVIATLSHIENLVVIASNSTFFYKGKPVIFQRVARDLGVRYILEGTVRKSNDKIRIIAQLIDAISGEHLWVGCYDSTSKDIFSIQDEIAIKIREALRVEFAAVSQLHKSDKKHHHTLSSNLSFNTFKPSLSH